MSCCLPLSLLVLRPQNLPPSFFIACVPAHWPTEVANALLMGVRRRRIKSGQPQLLWEELARLPFETEPALTTPQAKDVLTLGERHGLTVYDAAYLEIAHRHQLPHRPTQLAVSTEATKAGRTAAVLSSLIASCKRMRIEPFAYLRDLFTRINTHPHHRLDDLLLDKWLVAQQNVSSVHGET